MFGEPSRLVLVLAIPFEPYLKCTWVFNLTIGKRVEKSIQHCLILAHVCNFESNTAQPAKNVRQCSSKLAERACYELLHQGETLGNIPCDSNIMKWGCKKASLSIHGVLKLYSSEATLFPSNSFCMCSSPLLQMALGRALKVPHCCFPSSREEKSSNV